MSEENIGQAMTSPDERTTTFEAHRGYLAGLAYRMLGSVAEAEDVVQEAFLRWHGAAAGEIASPKAWLTTVATRLCIDQLRSAKARRETYVGPWLPEPVLTDGPARPDDAAEMLDSLSMALLILLERLSPAERAAWLLHDVFDTGYGEIAAIMDRPETACRQLVSRARRHIAAGRPRFAADPGHGQRILEGFAAATRDGDMDGLLALLAEDVTLWSDGGGKVKAALNPISGADRVARFLFGLAGKAPAGMGWKPRQINGEPGFIIDLDGRPFAAFVFEIAGDRIKGIRVVVNPDKLVSLDAPTGASSSV